MRSLKGRLLVATPSLGDPNFERTVVLMLEHGDEGALGVVLNRPSEVDVGTPLPEWDRFAAQPGVVFVGGPVGDGAMIGLARLGTPEPDEGFAPVIGPVGVLDLSSDPDGLVGIEQLRIFYGYAGWAPGQLEGEIDEAAWFVVDAEPADAMSAEPRDLWRAVLRRQPGRVRIFANFPADPSLN